MKKRERDLLGAEDRVLGRFGHAELHDALGLDLDGFARGRVATDSRLAVHQHQLAETGQREGVLGVFVGEFRDEFENLSRRLFGDAAFLRERGGDL